MLLLGCSRPPPPADGELVDVTAEAGLRALWLVLKGLDVGTRVVVNRVGAPDILRVVEGGGNFLAQRSPDLHLGLGPHSVRAVHITWRTGETTELSRPEPRQILTPERP